MIKTGGGIGAATMRSAPKPTRRTVLVNARKAATRIAFQIAASRER